MADNLNNLRFIAYNGMCKNLLFYTEKHNDLYYEPYSKETFNKNILRTEDFFSSGNIKRVKRKHTFTAAIIISFHNNKYKMKILKCTVYFLFQ